VHGLDDRAERQHAVDGQYYVIDPRMEIDVATGEATAENAEGAEKEMLGVLCELRGYFSPRLPVLKPSRYDFVSR
jgi:hypothetical protein